jgi:hypothetical protein
MHEGYGTHTLPTMLMPRNSFCLKGEWKLVHKADEKLKFGDSQFTTMPIQSQGIRKVYKYQ